MLTIFPAITEEIQRVAFVKFLHKCPHNDGSLYIEREDGGIYCPFCDMTIVKPGRDE